LGFLDATAYDLTYRPDPRADVASLVDLIADPRPSAGGVTVAALPAHLAPTGHACHDRSVGTERLPAVPLAFPFESALRCACSGAAVAGLAAGGRLR
jgi:hypothetical protein